MILGGFSFKKKCCIRIEISQFVVLYPLRHLLCNLIRMAKYEGVWDILFTHLGPHTGHQVHHVGVVLHRAPPVVRPKVKSELGAESFNRVTIQLDNLYLLFYFK